MCKLLYSRAEQNYIKIAKKQTRIYKNTEKTSTGPFVENLDETVGER